MPLGTQELIEAVEDYEAAGIWPDEEQMVAATQCDQFQIATKDQAAWALRKMSKIQAEVNENALAADIEIKRIMDWRISENAKLQGSLNFFEYLLMGYMQQRRYWNGRARLCPAQSSSKSRSRNKSPRIGSRPPGRSRTV
jgi:hypothetical protein